MSRRDHPLDRHARRMLHGWASAAADRAEAKSLKAEAKAARRERAGRRRYLEALRLADQEA